MPTTQYNIDNILKYTPVPLRETPQAAAVMILMLTSDYEAYDIVLTRRAADLPNYAGQYCLPGGFRDKKDKNLYATAVRETKEELGITSEYYQHLGQLDDFYDHDGNLVRPYVVIMNKTDFLEKNKLSVDEISEIYYFSLFKLEAIHEDPRLFRVTRRHPTYTFTDGSVFVWGLTAAILVHLLNVISGSGKPIGNTLQDN